MNEHTQPHQIPKATDPLVALRFIAGRLCEAPSARWSVSALEWCKRLWRQTDDRARARYNAIRRAYDDR